MWVGWVAAAWASPWDAEILWESAADHREPRAIVGGVSVSSGVDQVVALAWEDPPSGQLTVFCTGSVVAADWILTAAHCIDEGQQVSTDKGFRLVAVWGDDLPRKGADFVLEWAATHVDPTYDDIELTGDIGLVRLVDRHPDPTRVALRDESFGRREIGETLQVYGFGSTGDDRTDGGVKRTITLPIDDVDDARITTFTPEGNICSGDSGGPGFVAAASGWEQVGVSALVTPGCIGGRGRHTRVDRHLDWIRSLVPDVVVDPGELSPPTFASPEDPDVRQEDAEGGCQTGGVSVGVIGLGVAGLVRRRRSKRAAIPPTRPNAPRARGPAT